MKLLANKTNRQIIHDLKLHCFMTSITRLHTYLNLMHNNREHATAWGFGITSFWNFLIHESVLKLQTKFKIFKFWPSYYFHWIFLNFTLCIMVHYVQCISLVTITFHNLLTIYVLVNICDKLIGEFFTDVFDTYFIYFIII